jgi:hypothetical protein
LEFEPVTTYDAVRGDRRVIRTRLSDANGPLDLSGTGASVYVVVGRTIPDPAAVALTSVNLIDAANGIVELVLTSGPGEFLATAHGDYFMQWKAVTPGQDPVTIPTKGADLLRVGASVAIA